MSDIDAGALAGTATFQLGTLGAIATERFSTAIGAFGLKPKHAGVLQVLLLDPLISQQELAHKMGVAPSLMVGLLDFLESAGAIERERDPADRRRQVIDVTDEGERLYVLCARAAASIEVELLAGLGERAEGFRKLLANVAEDFGLPTRDTR
ncbi:MarR family winged helix-turn-helix transcriptional regulator [Phytomonospora endophytica]|uniref:DNA-binding MarR family transcriptional regulator n=1 Tax=Phytomonospora endophytica TaxID=714109 RepID=A0A841FXP9_9ACTN|nr:MarR family winged helix-turn-helix transcriptional regulator [Phytomonospora endophytica]MBB6038312.1 DNA-binding MarR family transcriptional regulator [Phytomonospora endophytica]